ncbi:MAG: chemotaxis protein CheV [Oleispira antarctica]|uniref:Putative chemotaxis protein CheV n=1 Tax=Oleispira antarctica RB-8 TaxID=698738 RepID=R4YLF8_OLEAN|nr:chemotaxis protein CheV [Oleispira antarctica]MBQ0794200.1 chemotaxis protein CheV [Oleispira antarctica]CCK75365.1 Putative chemotaxis protein CheV [Oleispira antarctica RB-8]|tara:strand:- start:875 stop:1810 length:936 start_codon:yes stop_codon:yes gene_type:complete
MAGLMESVDQRTQLVGANRLELLLFRMEGPQIYGINVFKVKEVLQCPKLTVLPHSHPVVRGVAHLRVGTLPIMDLSMATGGPKVGDLSNAFVIITEYNLKTQGFLVGGVERIVNMNWGDIHPPPKGTGREHYLTAVTQVEGKLVEIIDVEKVLAEVSPMNETMSENVVSKQVAEDAKALHVLIVDDSKIARKQVTRCLEEIGVEVTALNDGLEAWNHLQELTESGVRVQDKYLMLISDIEMPEMDGYTLTTNVRNDSRISDFHIVLHTSLSGVFNKAMVEKVGADGFISKFNPDILGDVVVKRIEEFTKSR